jgi:hypothetical protein
MISLKSAPKPKPGKEAAHMLMDYDPPAYPYGLCLSLNSETLTKLGIKDLPKVGTKVRITAVGEVISVSQRQELDGDQARSVDVQITDMEPIKGAASAGMYDKSEMEP